MQMELVEPATFSRKAAPEDDHHPSLCGPGHPYRVKMIVFISWYPFPMDDPAVGISQSLVLFVKLSLQGTLLLADCWVCPAFYHASSHAPL